MLDNFWNLIRWTLSLPVYDLVAGVVRKQRMLSIELLNLQPEERVLIVGAGTGLDLEFLRHCKHVTAIDLTPGMLAILRKRARKLGVQVDARVMDAHKLAFGDATFDAAVLHLIVAVIPDPVRCLQEVERVLRPGGRAVILDKFLRDNQRPGIGRLVLNFFLKIIATSINRRTGDILPATGLQKISDQDVLWNGLFRIILLRKPG